MIEYQYDGIESSSQQQSQLPQSSNTLCLNGEKQQSAGISSSGQKVGCVEIGISDNQSWTTDTSIPQDLELPNYPISQSSSNQSVNYYQNNHFSSPLQSPLNNQHCHNQLEQNNLFHSLSFENSLNNSLYYKETSPNYHDLSIQNYSSNSQSSLSQQHQHQQQHQQHQQNQQQQMNSCFKKKQPQQYNNNNNNNISLSQTLAHEIEGIENKWNEQSNNNSNYNRKQHITDRFIPSRKESKLSTYQAYECSENNSYYEQQYCNDSPRGGSSGTNQVLVKNAAEKEEINQISIAQLYKNYVLGVKDKRMYNLSLSSAHAFCPYKNENVLRFNKPSLNTNQNNNNILGNNNQYMSKSILQPNANYPNQLFLNLEEESCCSHLRYSRKISKVPFKVLDAPALQDDFYLNLIDWSSQNILAVGLSSCVYLWSACSSRVTKLCDFGRSNEVTSVNWSPRSSLISIGTNTGEVEIWDSVKLERVRVMKGHSQRVGTLAWNTNILTSGSRDKTILQRDLRTKNLYEQKLVGHKQEVCGLKWSFDEQQLASGGNDNKLYVWNMHSNKPIIKFGNHNAAVKALAWSPHQHGLLVSGGGTQDRTIRFWNTLTSRQLECIETGSQVCNLIFSKNVNELVSTHGYSQNQIIIWSYPEMEKLTTLTGHSCRVLYLAMSPDGQTIVTGAGDETLRFWNVFPSNKEKSVDHSSSLLLSKNNFIR